jgi:hypothetical protein
MERYFEKWKEGFLKKNIIYKNLPQFLHRCHGVGDIQVNLYNSFFRNSPYTVNWDNYPLIQFHTCHEQVSSQDDTCMFKEDIFSKYHQIF